MSVDHDWRCFAGLVPLILLVSACRQPAEEPPTPTQVFQCRQLLIGPAIATCREDVIGPGTLSVSFKPDPPRSSWEVSARGLRALAQACEFHGSFDQTRLSALQGRGTTELICPIGADVDRAFHEFSFENRQDTGSGSVSVTVSYSR